MELGRWARILGRAEAQVLEHLSDVHLVGEVANDDETGSALGTLQRINVEDFGDEACPACGTPWSPCRAGFTVSAGWILLCGALASDS